jgi:hypothetical protein
MTTEMENELSDMRNRLQFIDVILSLGLALIQIFIASWLCRLAMDGVRYHNPIWNPFAEFLQLMIFGIFTIWVVTAPLFTAYDPIRDDAAEGFRIINTKIKAAIKAIHETKVR